MVAVVVRLQEGAEHTAWCVNRRVLLEWQAARVLCEMLSGAMTRASRAPHQGFAPRSSVPGIATASLESPCTVSGIVEVLRTPPCVTQSLGVSARSQPFQRLRLAVPGRPSRTA